MWRCSGVLHARWSILQQPSRLWGLCDIENVVIACGHIANRSKSSQVESSKVEQKHNTQNMIFSVRVDVVFYHPTMFSTKFQFFGN